MSGFGRRSETSAPKARAVSSDPNDKRFAPRRKGRIPALIYCEGATQSVPCHIGDMSATGARIELRTGWDNPFRADASQMDQIRLVIRQDRVMYDCQIVRRSETELGLKFLAAPRPILKATR